MGIYKKAENILQGEKEKYIQKQDYVNAAAFRDMEKALYKYKICYFSLYAKARQEEYNEQLELLITLIDRKLKLEKLEKL